MKTHYQVLAETLERRLEVISDNQLRDTDPQEQLRQLQQVSESIQKWHTYHKGKIPSQLNHFLMQSSLGKALDYVKSEGLN
ncbi:MAG: hypothetical protein ABGY95_06995 [Rubritalea sp.]|uniref:hypothetical protein n=1 Tax=Rubritalea sp. TaxID=2109375 RepID=UPI0032421BE8